MLNSGLFSERTQRYTRNVKVISCIVISSQLLSLPINKVSLFGVTPNNHLWAIIGILLAYNFVCWLALSTIEARSIYVFVNKNLYKLFIRDSIVEIYENQHLKFEPLESDSSTDASLKMLGKLSFSDDAEQGINRLKKETAELMTSRNRAYFTLIFDTLVPITLSIYAAHIVLLHTTRSYSQFFTN